MPRSSATPKPPVAPRQTAAAVRLTIADLRRDAMRLARADPSARSTPIRVMARAVQSVLDECHRRGLPERIVQEQVVNRTIGDINLRLVVEHDQLYDYRTLADEMGIALPDEVIAGTVATGARYLELRARMMAHERTLLSQGIDLHMYDLNGVGNLLLREWLSGDAATWGFALPASQVYLANGSLDGLDKIMRGLRSLWWNGPAGIIFPAPGFNVPEWQAQTLGITPIRLHTLPEHGYKLTAAQLRETLAAHPETRGLYLIFSSNPSAYSYQPEEINAILAVLAEHPDIMLLADMAYTGTGTMAEEQARVAPLAHYANQEQIITFWTLSKVYTMTGDRFGWVCIGDPAFATRLPAVWANTIAALPAEWQLRFMAVYEFLRDHPQLRDKISALYGLRRNALVRQLSMLQAAHPLFAQINAGDGGTVYNWSRLAPDVDAFDLFAETGLAGVTGTAFGYDDDHVRFSIGIVPVPGWEKVADAGVASPKGFRS